VVVITVLLVVKVGVGQNFNPIPKRDLTFVGKSVIDVLFLRRSWKAECVGREK
jgi:hypothetical protein